MSDQFKEVEVVVEVQELLALSTNPGNSISAVPKKNTTVLKTMGKKEEEVDDNVRLNPQW